MNKDLYTISELIKGGNYQSIGDDETSYFLSVNLDEDEDEETAMEQIARLVLLGFTSGCYPSWNIEF